MEETKQIDLLVSITGLEKEFVTNSIKTEEGANIILNQFREKSKVFKKEDFELREKNLKEDHNSTYLTELIEMARNFKLPPLLYNAAANNIISAHNKRIAAEFDVKMTNDDFSNTESVFKSVKEKLSTVDNEQLQTDFEALQLTVKGFDEKFETQETTHKQEMKENNIEIISSDGLNKFSKNIDFETDEELTKRISVAKSMFNSLYDIDIVDKKTLIKDKKGNVIKNDITKENVTIDVIYDTEISQYVPMKKERSNTNRKAGDPKPEDGLKVTQEQLDKKLESGEIEAYSKEHVEAEAKLKDQ